MLVFWVVSTAKQLFFSQQQSSIEAGFPSTNPTPLKVKDVVDLPTYSIYACSLCKPLLGQFLKVCIPTISSGMLLNARAKVMLKVMFFQGGLTYSEEGAIVPKCGCLYLTQQLLGSWWSQDTPLSSLQSTAPRAGAVSKSVASQINNITSFLLAESIGYCPCSHVTKAASQGCFREDVSRTQRDSSINFSQLVFRWRFNNIRVRAQLYVLYLRRGCKAHLFRKQRYQAKWVHGLSGGGLTTVQVCFQVVQRQLQSGSVLALSMAQWGLPQQQAKPIRLQSLSKCKSTKIIIRLNGKWEYLSLVEAPESEGTGAFREVLQWGLHLLPGYIRPPIQCIFQIRPRAIYNIARSHSILF